MAPLLHTVLTLSTEWDSEKVMKPNPLDLLVAGSFMTITSASSPKMEKYSLMLSGVVCQERPPMNILPCLRILQFGGRTVKSATIMR